MGIPVTSNGDAENTVEYGNFGITKRIKMRMMRENASENSNSTVMHVHTSNAAFVIH